jgi:hypothetical protein
VDPTAHQNLTLLAVRRPAVMADAEPAGGRSTAPAPVETPLCPTRGNASAPRPCRFYERVARAVQAAGNDGGLPPAVVRETRASARPAMGTL